MSLKLIHTDLTRFHCDAVVLSPDENLEYGGSVFGACSSADLTDCMSGLLRKYSDADLCTLPIDNANSQNLLHA